MNTLHREPAPVKTRLAVFDIDGTLTDSVKAHQSAFVKALEDFGFTGFDTNWAHYLHHTDSFIFKTILEKQHNRTIVPDDLEKFEEMLYRHIVNITRDEPVKEIEGARQFLYGLGNETEFDIILATGSLLKPARHKLNQAGIPYPDHLIITANHVYSREEMVLSAIREAKKIYDRKDYLQVISFGDGLWDYETANNTKIDFIGIGNKKLPDYGVKKFYPDFKNLPYTGLNR